MALIHNNVFFGMWFCIALIFIAGGIIIGAIISEVAVPMGFMKRLEFEEMDTADDCSDTDLNLYFLNLTNVDAFLAGQEKPNFRQLGPYNFTRRSCTFDRKSNDSVQSYRRYWELPVLRSDSVGKINDNLVNFNPGFLGVMNALSKISPDPEYALLLNSIPAALAKVISGMQAPTFRYSVTSKGVEVAYNTILNSAIPQLEAIVRAGTGAAYVNNVITSLAPTYGGALPATLQFFNNASIQGGPSNYAGASLNFSVDSIQKIMNAWYTTDTVFFSGFLGFVGSNTSQASIFLTAYDISISQYGALETYAGLYLYTAVPNQFYGGAAGVTVAARQIFYGQWSNATTLPNGYDLDGNMTSTKDYFEVGTTVSNGSLIIVKTNISSASAAKLWNVSSTNSFLTSDGILFWLSAATDPVKAQTLIVYYGIDPIQFQFIVQWINQWNNIVVPSVIASINSYCHCNLTDLSQMAWAQWGSAAVLSGGSLAQYEPSLYVAPEFGVFALNHSINLSFSINKSQDLLNGTNGFLKTGSVVQFFTLLSQNKTADIAATWQINAQQIGALAQYFQYLASNLIQPTFSNQVFSQAGLIVGRTPLEWMYTAEDYFLEYIGQTDSNVGVLTDDSEASTKAEALAQDPYTEGVFHGGSKQELNDSLQVTEYKGSKLLLNYNPQLKVHGYDGTQFVPGLDPSQNLDIFTPILKRVMTFEFKGETKTRGIKTWRYDLIEKNWEDQYENPENAAYPQLIHGLQNVTNYKKIPTFYSRPHFYGVGSGLADQVTGLDAENEYYKTWSIDVEPESGITMQKRLPGQVSFGIAQFPRFYPNVVSGIYPIAWQDDSKVLTEDDADEFKKTVGGARVGANVAFCLGPAIGAVIILTIIYLRKTQNRGITILERETGNSNNAVEMKKVIKPVPSGETPLASQAKDDEKSSESSGGSSSGSASGSSSESD